MDGACTFINMWHNGVDLSLSNPPRGVYFADVLHTVLTWNARELQHEQSED